MAQLNGRMLRDIDPPNGWVWSQLPDTDNRRGVLWQETPENPDVFRERMESLRDWLIEYQLGMECANSAYMRFPLEGSLRGVYVVQYAAIKLTTHTRTMAEYFGPVHGYPPLTVIDDAGGVMSCFRCSRGGITLWADGLEMLCAYHSNLCRQCEQNRHSPEWGACAECGGPRGICTWCGEACSGDWYVSVTAHQRDDNNQIVPDTEDERVYCQGCAESLCENCEAQMAGDSGYNLDDGRNVCSTCYDRYFDEYGRMRETDDELEIPAEELVIHPTDGRDRVRDVGVEIEGGGDGRTLAQQLHMAGLAPAGEVLGYHSAGTFMGEFPVHIERDSSVDWEMVIGRFNPSDVEAMQTVNRILRIARSEVKNGRSFLDLRCGTHIHVDAHGAGVKTAYNLHTLFGYMEDVLFRVGAAKWGVHRTVRTGPMNHAAQPIPKGPFENAIQFAMRCNTGDHEHRYWALNLQPFWHSTNRNCNCGAIRYGRWEDCTCNLGKCTFEFRVFNGTLNPRKLHAYIALSQAMVAKALTEPELSGDDYPAQEWSYRPIKKMGETDIHSHMEAWQPRLQYMFRELPLTHDERSSLLYCVENSELNILGDAFLGSLA